MNGFFVAQLRAEEVSANAVLPRTDFSELQLDTKAVKIQKVVDPLTLLAGDSTIYKLTGLDIPGLESGTSDIPAQAMKELTELLAGQEIRVYLTKDKTRGRLTRLNQTLIHAERKKDNLWIQGRLVADGLARVRTTPANPEMARELLALEELARAKKKGLWADPEYSVLTPDTAATKKNSFQIVEGRVFSVSTRNNETFLNFTHDWRKDFSIGIPSEMRRDLSKKSIDPMSLAHKSVRVRGWIEDRNGPFITLDHAQQLEILGSALPPIEKPAIQGLRTFKTPAPPEVEKPASPVMEKPAANE
jgi:endonuclease YncB( thermonuclease family)